MKKVEPARDQPANRIEDHALIGDGTTAALVRFDGTIDWLCWPRFDSPACFASLLGTAENGHWSIHPSEAVVERSRRYVEDTLVLETDHGTASGSVRVTDFMWVGDGPSSVARSVTGLTGRVAMRLELALRFDLGRIMPWVGTHRDGMTATVGPDCVVFRSPLPITPDPAGSSIEFVVEAGQTVAFVLSHGSSSGTIPAAVDAAEALADTTRYWRSWIAGFDRPTDWPLAVRRSLLTLVALVHRPTGGMIAAPTTSLPEIPNGTSNWDYRYCWLRDATFMMCTLLNAGFKREATAWRDWLLRAMGSEPKKLRIAYRVDGAVDLEERTIDWLPGYEGASPVRVGNGAWNQHQLDVYGEVIDSMAVALRGGIEPCAQGLHVERELIDHIESIWQMPGHGIWESREAPRHYVYSKVMAWVGIDRYLTGAASTALDADARTRLNRLRTSIHEDVCANGYHAECGTFVQHYDSDDLDASLLLLPILGFLPVDDPRIVRTIDAIESRMTIDGFVMRTVPADDAKPEGAFLPCTLWLADCRLMQGRHGEARAGLERVLAVGNDLGLLSEEYDVAGKRLSGNFPQALTHLAIVNTALNLCGPILQRSSG